MQRETNKLWLTTPAGLGKWGELLAKTHGSVVAASSRMWLEKDQAEVILESFTHYCHDIADGRQWERFCYTCAQIICIDVSNLLWPPQMCR